MFTILKKSSSFNGFPTLVPPMPWPTFALKRFASALEKEGVASKAMLEVGRPAKG
jgi:hypothetical protein